MLGSLRRPRVRRAAAILASAGIVVLWAAHPVAGADEGWPMAGGDPAHQATAGGPAPPYSQSWRVEVGAGGPVAGPIVSQDIVVVVARTGIVALDAATGDRRWEADRREGPAGVPAVAGGLVIHASGVDAGAALVARDLSEGTERWRTFTGSVPSSPITVAGGTAFVGTRDGHVLALEAATGEERWRYSADGAVRAAPAVAEGLVVAVADGDASGPSTVYALDADTGGGDEGPAWRFSPTGTPGPFTSSPAISEGRVVAAMSDGRIRALDLGTGAERWATRSRDLAGPLQIPSARGPSLVLADRLHLYGLDPGSGEERWNFRLADLRDLGDGRFNTLDLSSPATVGQVAVIGDGSGLLSAVDVRSGHRVWRGDVGPGGVGAVAADGTRLYVTSRGEEGTAVALEHDPDGVLLDEVSPTVLFPLRALLSFAVAALLVGGVLIGLFRYLLRRRPRPEDAS